MKNKISLKELNLYNNANLSLNPDNRMAQTSSSVNSLVGKNAERIDGPENFSRRSCSKYLDTVSELVVFPPVG